MQNCIEVVGLVDFDRHGSSSYFSGLLNSHLFSFISNYHLLFTLFGDVMSGGMHPGGQWFSSMADNEIVAASSEDAALPETLDLAAAVSSRNVRDHCAFYGRLLDASRLRGCL